jgi:hypothetical protein
MQPCRKVFAIVTAWKVTVSLLFALSVYNIAPNPSIHVGMPTPHPAILKATASWDGGWYSAIASEGYGDVPNPRLAFFPLFPVLAGLISRLCHLDLLLAGLLLNTAAVYFAAWFLFSIARDFFDSERAATVVLLLFLFFPTAFFLNAFYTEAMFCALAFGAFAYSRRCNWPVACLLLGLTTATRLPSVAVVFGVFIEYLSSRQFSVKHIDRQILWFLLAPTGLVGYMLFQQLSYGDALAFVKVYELEWPIERDIDPRVPLTVVNESLRGIRALRGHDVNGALYSLIPTTAWLAALFLTIRGIRILPLSYSAFSLSSLVVFSLHGTLVSSNRYVLPLFPLYLVLCLMLGELSVAVWIAISAALMGAFALAFGAFYWIG